MKSRSLRRLRRAFTLSELLACISIIVLLMALAFPVFSKAKLSSRGTVCISNLHQIGVATQVYMTNYDDRYPRVINAISRTNNDVWFGRDKSIDPAPFPTPREALVEVSPGIGRVMICSLDLGLETRGDDYFPRLSPANDGSSYVFAELFEGQTADTWVDPSKARWSMDGGPFWHSLHYDPDKFDTYIVNALFYDWHVKREQGMVGVSFRE